MSEGPFIKKAGRYFVRALRLRCPICGLHPLFRPLHKVRGVTDWYETLAGCPRCDYEYDRESGYFMLALWSFVYGPAALLGIGLLIFFTTFYHFTTGQLLLVVLAPTLIFAVLIVRHAKAFYLTIDQYFFYKRDEH